VVQGILNYVWRKYTAEDVEKQTVLPCPACNVVVRALFLGGKDANQYSLKVRREESR